MSISRFSYDPFTEFDRLFDDAFATRFRFPPGAALRGYAPGEVQRPGPFAPKLDLHENTENNTVTATFELPGLKRENVNIDVHNDRLTISGESESASAQDEGGYTIRERRYGKFARTLQLPIDTKPGDVKAKMEHGVLTVTFPKVNPEQQPHRVAIE